MKRIFISLLLALSVALVGSAQITVPYPAFQANTDIRSAEVNADFSALSTNALNRTGGTVTGALTSSGGSLAGSWAGSPTFSGTPTFSGAVTFGSTTSFGGIVYTWPAAQSASQYLQTNGSGTLSWGTVDLTSLNATNLTSGTVPDARFPTTLPAVSGANLTNLNAANLASGTVPLARLPGTTTLVKSANYTVTTADGADVVIVANTSSGAFTVTLPDPSGNAQRITVVKAASGTNAVTIAPHGSETIGGESSLKAYANHDFITVVSDGTNWEDVAEKVTIYARAYRATSAQLISTGTPTKVQFNAEEEDSANAFDSTTNYRFTAPRAGRYRFAGVAYMSGVNSGVFGYLYKNGSLRSSQYTQEPSGDASATHAGEVRLATGDYVEFYVRHDRGSDVNLNVGSTVSYFEISYAGN